MNYFYSKSNLLTSEECEQFISRLDKESLPLSPWYRCVYANLYDYDFLEKKVREAVIEYINLHPFLNNIPMEWHIDAPMNLQWYEPGEAFSAEHCEHGCSLHDQHRILGWMIYLNNVYDKGETYWPQQNYKVNPEAGKFLIWPAAWTHSHYGIASPTENKYVITGWCSFVSERR